MSADDTKWSTKVVRELLTLYRTMPALWKVKTREYQNRNLRKECYEKLIAYCKTIFPEADKEFVNKKIQRLRRSFRKEFKKVVASRRSGNGAEDVYVPTLWYYKLLLFTKDQDTPSASVSNMEEEPSLLNEAELMGDEAEQIDPEVEEPLVNDMDDTETQPHNQVSLFMTYYSFILVLLSRQNHLSLYPAQFLYLSVSLFFLLISATRQPEHSLTADGLLIYLSRHYTYILFHRTPHIHSLTHSCSRDRPECSVIQSSSLSTTFAEITTYLLYRLNSQFLNKLHCSQQILSSFYTFFGPSSRSVVNSAVSVK